MKRGLVLGAGGVLGAAWTIGALSAYRDLVGAEPGASDVIIGTSAGSVVAAFLGAGLPVDTLLNHQRGVVSEDDPHIDYDHEHGSGGALPPRPRLRMGSQRLLRHTALRPWRYPPMAAISAVLPQGRGSLRPVGDLVEAVVPAGEWAPHPATWIIAMDYDSGRRVPFGRPGSPPAGLSEAVMASCAIPGWYAPVTIGGRRYVDGGACSPNSLDLLAREGLDEVYVFSPMTSFELDSPTSVAARLERQLRRLVTRRLQREAAKVRAGGAKVVVVCPGAEDLVAMGVNLMDPRRRETVLDTSLRTSRAALDKALHEGSDIPPGGLATAS